MADENLLVLLLDDDAEPSELQREIARRRGDVHVLLVVPAHVGPLSWYATDEHEAQVEAADQTRHAGRRLAGIAEHVEADSGESDPVLAVGDALEEFAATEIVIAGGEGTNGALESSLQRFGLPVTRLGPEPDDSRGDRLRELGRGVMSGRSSATPYAIVVGVMAVLAAAVLLMLAVGLLVLWLS
jgi:hypothetical protein